MGYLTQKISYYDYPFEKHLAWMAFNVGWGALVGSIVCLNNPAFRRKYIDFFAIYGYAMIYVAAYLFKTQIQEEQPKEWELTLRSMGFSVASIMYATGLLKMAGQAKMLPNARVYASVLLT